MVRFDPKLLSPIRHRSAQMQADLAVLRARDTLVRTRTKCINAARGLVKSGGARLPACSAESFVHRVSEHVPSELQAALVPLLRAIAALNSEIRTYDRQIETLSRESYPQTAVLGDQEKAGADDCRSALLRVARRSSSGCDCARYPGRTNLAGGIPPNASGQCYDRPTRSRRMSAVIRPRATVVLPESLLAAPMITRGIWTSLKTAGGGNIKRSPTFLRGRGRDCSLSILTRGSQPSCPPPSRTTQW